MALHGCRFFFAFALAFALLGAVGADAADPILDGFRNPPASARPRTWWHWMHGYVSKEGITADLEAMKELGLGGFTLFDVGYWPEITGPVVPLTDAWYDLVLFAGREAERLGLAMGVHNCPGWTSSGGPWIKPEQAMKDYFCVEAKDGKVPKADDHTIAILAVPELPADAVRVPDFKFKSFIGNNPFDNGAYKTNVVANVPAASVIKKDKVIDLTHGGTVPSEGKWTVLHFRWKAKNVTNHPAAHAARGLECDKLSKEGVDAALGGMLARVAADQRRAGVRSLQTTLIDSYERGPQSWTQKMPEEFRARRGYDLVPFLPVLTGRYVESGAASEKFLADLRRTNADLFSHWYGAYFVERAHALGIQVEIEPYPGHFDELLQAYYADIPMGEFWRGSPSATGWSALVGAVGRARRRPFVQTESFTSGMKRTDGWAVTPGMLKRQGDNALAKGVNRFCFHTFAHQPWKGPIASAGMGMGPWGMDFNRANTLWPYFKPWIAYLGRAGFLLQQGVGASDALYVGEENPPVRFKPPKLPFGYQLDAIDAAHFRTDATRDGDFTVLANGQRYRYVVRADDNPVFAELKPDFFVEPKLQRDIPWVHRRLDDGTELYFVANIGEKPRAFTATFRAQAPAVELWDAETGAIEAANAARTDDGRTQVALDLGFSKSVFVMFRPQVTAGVRTPPAQTGEKVPDESDVLADLAKDWDVVFQPGRGAPASAHFATLASFSDNANPGIRYFAGEAVYTKTFTLPPSPSTLNSQPSTPNSQPSTPNSQPSTLNPQPLTLNLGAVHDACRVKLNGIDLGILWKEPWTIDITAAAKPGENVLEVTVANKWSNRMIGDAQNEGPYPGTWKKFRDKLYLRDYPEDFARTGKSPEGYFAFATLRTFEKCDKLFPSGLLGPVTIRRSRTR